jgi:hypothetical protein
MSERRSTLGEDEVCVETSVDEGSCFLTDTYGYAVPKSLWERYEAERQLLESLVGEIEACPRYDSRPPLTSQQADSVLGFLALVPADTPFHNPVPRAGRRREEQHGC